MPASELKIFGHFYAPTIQGISFDSRYGFLPW